MCEEDLSPLFLVVVFVLDGPLCDLDQICFSFWISVLQLEFLLDQQLEVFYVLLTLESLPFKLCCKFLIDFAGEIFTLMIFYAFSVEDSELFMFVLEFL